MNAEFLAMTLVIVYVGAIAVLFLFVAEETEKILMRTSQEEDSQNAV